MDQIILNWPPGSILICIRRELRKLERTVYAAPHVYDSLRNAFFSEKYVEDFAVLNLLDVCDNYIKVIRSKEVCDTRNNFFIHSLCIKLAVSFNPGNRKAECKTVRGTAV